MSAAAPPVGLAVSSIGRPALRRLLLSAAASTAPPAVVAVANQSGRPLDLDTSGLPFAVRVVPSAGGVSRGRNDAVAALAGQAAVLAFPNDDCTYPPTTLQGVRDAFAGPDAPAAVGGVLQDAGRSRLVPPPSAPLDARSVWRVIGPAGFVAAEAFDAVGGFRPDLGTGADSPWQSGEETDLLLRLLERGRTVLGRPDLVVLGAGERRGLSPSALVAKHRGYARGTGRVYREHPYSAWARARTVLGPWARATSHDPDPRLSLRLAAARSVGRVEGLAGRTLGTRRPVRWS